MTRWFGLVVAGIMLGVVGLAAGTTPLELNGPEGGCGNFTIYKSASDETKVLWIDGKLKTLRLTEDPKTFDLGRRVPLTVEIRDYGTEKHPAFCTDIIAEKMPKVAHLRAKSGQLRLSKSESTASGFYDVTAELLNVTFKPINGAAYTIDRLELKNVKVGWLPG